jgi:REP element-mobilizing transposase RayT
MSHSYVNNLVHLIFSTKARRPLISADLQERLWPYLGGIARAERIPCLAIGGVEDHVHLLLAIPATCALAKAVQLIKGNSSKWVRETFADQGDFGWQEGYGAFSTGISQAPATIEYIRKQVEHHRKKTFEEEFLAILQKHGIEYDSRHVFG